MSEMKWGKKNQHFLSDAIIIKTFSAHTKPCLYVHIQKFILTKIQCVSMCLYMKMSANIGDHLKEGLEINKFRFRPKIKISEDVYSLVLLGFQSYVNYLDAEVILSRCFFCLLPSQEIKYMLNFQELQCDFACTQACTCASVLFCNKHAWFCQDFWMFIALWFTKITF